MFKAVCVTAAFPPCQEVSRCCLKASPMVSDGGYSLKDAVASSDLQEEHSEGKAGQTEWSSTDSLCFLRRAWLHPNYCRILHPSPGGLSQLGSDGPAAWLPLFN